MLMIRVLVVVGVSLAFGQASAQQDFGCGTIEPDVEGGCMLFCPFTGGQYMLDNYGEFLSGSDSIHVLAGSVTRTYCGVWGKDYLQSVVITKCVATEHCCSGRVGDANGSGDENPTIGDISVIIDAKFIPGACITSGQNANIRCLAEADINQSGGCNPTCEDITIGDIVLAIDLAFITECQYGPPWCSPECLVCP
jgi:hypothetical protein